MLARLLRVWLLPSRCGFQYITCTCLAGCCTVSHFKQTKARPVLPCDCKSRVQGFRVPEHLTLSISRSDSQYIDDQRRFTDTQSAFSTLLDLDKSTRQLLRSIAAMDRHSSSFSPCWSLVFRRLTASCCPFHQYSSVSRTGHQPTV